MFAAHLCKPLDPSIISISAPSWLSNCVTLRKKHHSSSRKDLLARPTCLNQGLAMVSQDIPIDMRSRTFLKTPGPETSLRWQEIRAYPTKEKQELTPLPGWPLTDPGPFGVLDRFFVPFAEGYQADALPAQLWGYFWERYIKRVPTAEVGPLHKPKNGSEWKKILPPALLLSA